MKRSLIFILLFIPFIVYAQSTYTKGLKYKGYIFDKDIFTAISPPKCTERYTPTKEDIRFAEKILTDSIGYIRKNQPKHKKSVMGIKWDSYPIDLGTLPYYRRQYVGFKTEEGDSIIWINFLKDSTPEKDLSEDLVMVLDGGSNYWYIFINITRKELFGMLVNGES